MNSIPIMPIVVLFCLLIDIVSEYIKSREEKFVYLNENNQCKIFFYQSILTNNNNLLQHNSDFIICLFNGNSPTTTISLSQIDSIDIDNDNNNRVFSASSKKIIVNSFQRHYSKIIKISFCDYTYSFNDYFYVIEEAEHIILKGNYPIVIDRFYHLNEYTFEFVSSIQKHTKYELQINSKYNNSKGRIDVFINELSASPIYSINEFKVSKILEADSGDIIYIKMLNEDTLLYDNEISVLITKYDSVIVLDEDNTDERYISQQMSLYYYINLSSYHYNNEGVVSFHINDVEVIDNNIIVASFAKIIKSDINSFNSINPIIKEENEFKWEKDNNNELYYTIQFKKDINSDTLYLLLYFKFTEDWFKPFMIRVAHLKRIQTLIINKEHREVSFNAKKNYFYYYKIIFDDCFIDKTILIQTYSFDQCSLTVLNNNRNDKYQGESIYQSFVPKEKIMTIKYLTLTDQNISFIITISITQEAIYSIHSLSNLYFLIKDKPIYCFHNLFYYQSYDFGLNDEEENVYYSRQLINEFDFYAINSIISINNNYNEMNIMINSDKYAPISQLNKYQQKIVLIQCKKQYSTIKQDMALTSKDFSIEVKWNQSKVNYNVVYNIYLISKYTLLYKSSNITHLMNTAKPYISLRTNKTSHLIYPIQSGQYSLFLISLTQLNNTIIVKENSEPLILIPTIIPTSITILLIMISLLVFLSLLMIIKSQKAKEE